MARSAGSRPPHRAMEQPLTEQPVIPHRPGTSVWRPDPKAPRPKDHPVVLAQRRVVELEQIATWLARNPATRCPTRFCAASRHAEGVVDDVPPPSPPDPHARIDTIGDAARWLRLNAMVDFERIANGNYIRSIPPWRRSLRLWRRRVRSRSRARPRSRLTTRRTIRAMRPDDDGVPAAHAGNQPEVNMLAYLEARWHETTSILAKAGLAGIALAYVTGQMTDYQALVGAAVAVVLYLHPEAKGALGQVSAALGAAIKPALVMLALAGLGLSACGGAAGTALLATGGAGAGVAAGSTLASAGSTISTANAAVPVAYTVGCAAIETADDLFQMVAPTLLQKGDLLPAQVSSEATIAKAARARCANPPTDLLSAGKATIQDAIGIYGMIGQPVPSTLAKAATAS